MRNLRRDFEDLNAIIDLVKAMDPAADDLNEQVNGVKEKLSQLDISSRNRKSRSCSTALRTAPSYFRNRERPPHFSRMDGDNFIQAQLNESIESTLIVLRSNFKDGSSN